MCNYYTQKYGILDTLLCLFIFASFLLIQRIWIGGRLHYKQDSARNHRSLENHRPNCESVQHNYSQCYCHIGGTNHPYAVFCLSFSVIFVKKYVKNTFVKLYLHPVTLFENYSKCRIWIFEFWHFPPIFDLLKVACLVTLFDRRFQVFKKSPNWPFLAFLMIFCPL